MSLVQAIALATGMFSLTLLGFLLGMLVGFIEAKASR